MSFLKRQKALVIGIGIIVMTNAVALGGVAYNRSGTAESRLSLSDRELSYDLYRRDDNSGVAVSLLWKVLSSDILGPPRKDSDYDWYNYSNTAHWLTKAKMAELGFDVKEPGFRGNETYRYKQLKDREVFLVLEFNGPAYEIYARQAKVHAEALESKEEAARQIKAAEVESSRLFVVDAGMDAETLRRRYPDRHQYAIAKGIVSANWQGDGIQTVLHAYVNRLSVTRLHVPKPYDAVFNVSNYGSTVKLRVDVDVDYGKRHEPWIASAKTIAQ